MRQCKGENVTETALLLELIKNVGFPALIFAVWYLYHRSQVKAWESQMAAVREREERTFSLLTGQLEALQCIVAQNARMETKIDSNLYCPMMREKHA